MTRILTALLFAVTLATSPALLAETKEQKVRLSVEDPGGGAQCEVKAVFKGDHDNCKNHDAHGRDDCKKDGGCVCTRQEKHVAWQMKNNGKFEIKFDQGSDNPFVQKGSNECKFKANKEGKLRCRVKGKDVSRGLYHYSIHAQGCKPATAHIKVY